METESVSRQNPYKIIFENTGTAMALFEADHTLTLVNDKFCSLSGFSREELEHRKKWTELIAGEYLPLLVKYDQQRRIDPNSVPFSYDMAYLNKSEEQRYATISVTVIPETGQSLISCVDITENKQIEQCKEWSREILHILNEEADIQGCIRNVVRVFKEKGDFDAVGIRMQEGNDFPYLYQEGFPEDFIATESPLVQRTPDGTLSRDSDGNPKLECTCGLVISGKMTQANELFTPGGSFWTNDSPSMLNIPIDQDMRLTQPNVCIQQGYNSIALVPVRNRDKIIGLIQLNDRRKGRFSPIIMGYLEEIANQLGLSLMQKRYEEALAESEQNFRTFAEEFTQGIMIDEKGTGPVLYANKALLALFDMESMGEFVSRSFQERYTEDSIAILEERRLREENGLKIPDEFELKIKKPDGSIRVVQVIKRDIIWNGEDKRLTIFEDVTEQRHLEDQVRHSQVLASLGEMTAGIAHEVGNPLASIVLYSEVAMQGEDVPRQTKNDLKVIHNEAKRAGKLMKDLLAYSRKLEPNIGRLDLRTVIEKVVSMLQYQMGVQNVNITVSYPEAPLEVNGDAAQLTQVFFNLVMNAGEATRSRGGGNICVSASLEKDWVQITVADDGPGIPEQFMEQIFMPFFTTKKIGEGTGLGLSLCFGIVTSHGGTIEAANNKTAGATFTVRLPRREAAE